MTGTTLAVGVKTRQYESQPLVRADLHLAQCEALKTEQHEGAGPLNRPPPQTRPAEGNPTIGTVDLLPPPVTTTNTPRARHGGNAKAVCGIMGRMSELVEKTAPAGAAPGGRVWMLDIVRGFSMFFICGGEAVVLALCACFPGEVSQTVAKQMGHAHWEGFRFYDLIFPTFLLISGAAFTFAWRRQEAKGVPAVRRWGRLALRTLSLVALGVVYNGALEQTSPAAVRFPSVLARIGLGVFLAAAPYAFLRGRWRCAFLPVGLAAYALLFALCGGETPYAEADNWAGAVDRTLLPGRLLGAPDPEGVVSTLGATLTAFLGMMLGDFLRTGVRRKALWIALAGGALIAAAHGMSPWVPVVKKLWTSSYVCLAGGWTLLLCAFFHLLADTFRLKRTLFFLAFIGTNALWFYFLPRYFDFATAAWKIVGGLTRAWGPGRPWQSLIASAAGMALLWLSVWALRRPRHAS